MSVYTEYSFEIPTFIRPARYEELRVLDIKSLTEVPVEWPILEGEEMLTEPTNIPEVADEHTGLFREIPYFHIDWLRDITSGDYSVEEIESAILADKVFAIIFTSSTGTEFAGMNIAVRTRFLEDLLGTQKVSAFQVIATLNAQFGDNWIDLYRPDIALSDTTGARKSALEHVAVLGEVSFAQTPDLHFAKGSLQRTLHRSAKKRTCEPSIRNFRRVNILMS
jgi:hypothetical protein